MRSDIIKLYKDVHSWVGIISGLALFIAFYAGAITMFEIPLQRWASSPSEFGSLTPLERTEELVSNVQKKYPEAARAYQIVLVPSSAHPARMSWASSAPSTDEHDVPMIQHANLMDDGTLQVVNDSASGVGQLVDDLHRQIGLPFDHEIAMPIMGAIALLYAIALVSGTIVLIPTLVKDLYAFRMGKNLKRMWLDLHNVLGLFSLPFHIIMALTAVVFAFHDQFYDAQEVFFNRGDQQVVATATAPAQEKTGEEERVISRKLENRPLSPEQIVKRLTEQAPGFRPSLLNYQAGPNQELTLRVMGKNSRYGMRSPEGGLGIVDAYSGDIVATDYLPGLQSSWAATITSFFTLHFGSYGGNSIRWSYFFLGLAGAFLFYTGNLLWVETRRKKQRRGTSLAEVEQKKSTRIMGVLTVGVSLGCVAGISISIAAAKVLPSMFGDVGSWHTIIYYIVFLAMVGWALMRGVARASVDLLLVTAVAMLLIPIASLLSLSIPAFGWNHSDFSVLVDVVAIIGALILSLLARKTATRIKSAPMDSIWYVGGNVIEVEGVALDQA